MPMPIQGRNFALRILLPAALLGAQQSAAQEADSSRKELHLSGAVTVTNKGISFIPSFSLGKPAAIFNLSMGRKKLSFEPELRFSLQGKPWSMLFWGRYRPISEGRFRLTLGSHLGLNYKTDNYIQNNIPASGLVTRRYLAGELAPQYLLSPNARVGFYYLYSRGLDEGTIRNTQFFTVNGTISSLPLGRRLLLGMTPQLYYLGQDAYHGFYFTSSFGISLRNFPLSLQAIINKTIHSNIPGNQDFIWNSSIIYSFNKTYVSR